VPLTTVRRHLRIEVHLTVLTRVGQASELSARRPGSLPELADPGLQRMAAVGFQYPQFMALLGKKAVRWRAPAS
jgi:hypothetical protein